MIFDLDWIAEELYAQVLAAVVLDPAHHEFAGVVLLPSPCTVWLTCRTDAPRRTRLVLMDHHGQRIAVDDRDERCLDLDRIEAGVRRLVRGLGASPRGRATRKMLFGKHLRGVRGSRTEVGR
jgi:hypothetical protein